MKKQISRSPEWTEDVLSTFHHIALDNVTAADEYLDAIEELLGNLMAHPELGEAVQFANTHLEGLRVVRLSAKFRKHLVFYVPKEKSIHVARILHKSRNIEPLFSDD